MFKLAPSHGGFASVAKPSPIYSISVHGAKARKCINTSRKAMATAEASRSTKGQEVSQRENWDLWRNRIQGQSPKYAFSYGDLPPLSPYMHVLSLYSQHEPAVIQDNMAVYNHASLYFKLSIFTI